jgi:lipoprotein-anchoring transpeptidase ErfK/SrfK
METLRMKRVEFLERGWRRGGRPGASFAPAQADMDETTPVPTPARRARGWRALPAAHAASALLAALALSLAPPPPVAAQSAGQTPPPAAPAPGSPAPPSAPPPGSAAPPPAEVQILLDRVNFSPGLVDGTFGDNTRKALAAFQEAHDLPVTGEADAVTWQNLTAASGGRPWTTYTITPDDVQGPFYAIPPTLEEQARLPALGYSSPLQLLASRFHCAEKLLRERNPGAQLAAGETLQVPNVRQVAEKATHQPGGEVRVVVSKSRLSLIVDNGDDLLFFAPVSAGSEHDPLPLGTWEVRGVSRNPVFHYNPALFWNANPRDAKVTIAAGPNNPVGLVWIDLSKEHYGIHGTPDPARIGTAFSHGCVRLTNWDALTVAGLVRPGTRVVFEP